MEVIRNDKLITEIRIKDKTNPLQLKQLLELLNSSHTLIISYTGNGEFELFISWIKSFVCRRLILNNILLKNEDNSSLKLPHIQMLIVYFRRIVELEIRPFNKLRLIKIDIKNNSSNLNEQKVVSVLDIIKFNCWDSFFPNGIIINNVTINKTKLIALRRLEKIGALVLSEKLTIRKFWWEHMDEEKKSPN